MSATFDLLCLMVPLITPHPVALSVRITAGGWGCPMSSSACLCSTKSLAFTNTAAISASIADAITFLGIAEAKEHGEVSFCWIPGKTNPSDVFAKEDNDVQHHCSLRDLMVKAREDFCDKPLKEETSEQDPVEVGDICEDANKENADPVPFSHADTVKQGPANRGLSPLWPWGVLLSDRIPHAALLESLQICEY